jgi:hypothetical protein
MCIADTIPCSGVCYIFTRFLLKIHLIWLALDLYIYIKKKKIEGDYLSSSIQRLITN